MTYQAMLKTFGLEAHAPWLLLATAAHLVCVVLIFRLVSRYVGVVVGLMAAMAMLVFSQGSEDLFWSFQIGFYGALICGLVALEVALGSVWTAWRHRRDRRPGGQPHVVGPGRPDGGPRRDRARSSGPVASRGCGHGCISWLDPVVGERWPFKPIPIPPLRIPCANGSAGRRADVVET